jgi:malonate transporter and related proteins
VIAEALVPIFFVMFLGYFAGARRIINNQHVASLIVLLLTFAVPVAAFVGIAQTSRSGLEENGKLVFILVISMLVIFGITFALNHCVFRLSPGENAVQSLSVGFPNFAAVGLPLLGSVMGPGSAISAAVSLAAGSVFIAPLALAVLETRGKAAGFFISSNCNRALSFGFQTSRDCSRGRTGRGIPGDPPQRSGESRA